MLRLGIDIDRIGQSAYSLTQTQVRNPFHTHRHTHIHEGVTLPYLTLDTKKAPAEHEHT